MRATAKALAERALVSTGVAALSRARKRRDVLVLAYHNVLPDGESPAGDASLHLPRREFARQLDAIARTHDVVPLAAVLDRAAAPPRPRVVITFDDAYLGALIAGVPELTRRGMPATIFVAPGLLGSHTWWDLLADPRSGSVPPAVRDRVLTELAGDRDATLTALGAEGAQPPGGPSLRIATQAELASLVVPGIMLGSHSWSHRNLCALAPDGLEQELRRSMEWLREHFPNVAPWLSYPYGLYSPMVERVAAAHGYVGALRVDGGWSGRVVEGDRYAVPRYNVPSGLSIDGFRLRLAGLGA